MLLYVLCSYFCSFLYGKRQRINLFPILMYTIVQVRACRKSCIARSGNNLSLSDFVPCFYQYFRKMRIQYFIAIRCFITYQLTICCRLPRLCHNAASDRRHRCSLCHCNIQSVMYFLFVQDRIFPHTKSRGQHPLHRGQPSLLLLLPLQTRPCEDTRETPLYPADRSFPVPAIPLRFRKHQKQ